MINHARGGAYQVGRLCCHWKSQVVAVHWSTGKIEAARFSTHPRLFVCSISRWLVVAGLAVEREESVAWKEIPGKQDLVPFGCCFVSAGDCCLVSWWDVSGGGGREVWSEMNLSSTPVLLVLTVVVAVVVVADIAAVS